MILLARLLACLLASAAPAAALGALPDLGAAGRLGPRLELPGLEIRPPAGFAPLRVVGEETGALAPGVPGAPRQLLLSLLRQPDALFALSRIEAPFEDGPRPRDRLARAALDHAREALGVDLHLLWAERVGPGVQVAARYELAGKERGLLLGFLPLGEETLVATLSAPAAALEELQPTFAAVVQSVQPLRADEPPPGAALWALAAASLLGGAAAASVLERRATPPSKNRR